MKTKSRQTKRSAKSLLILTLILNLGLGFAKITTAQTTLSAKTLMEQPMSVSDLPCGQYQLAAQLQTWPSGEDVLVFYPETEREFSIPILGLTTQQSLEWSKVMAIYQVQLPLIKGKKQGRLYFEKFHSVATHSQIYEKPVERIGDSCVLPEVKKN